MAWDETNPITGKRIPIWQNSNIPQDEKISTYVQHPQALYEDFGIENKSFQDNFARLSPKKRTSFLNNTYDDIASDDSAIIKKINESTDPWSATKINRLGRNQTKIAENLSSPINLNTNLSYSFQKDVPIIQELKSHSLDNPLRNSKLIGPEGKNDLYQFTIKNHDGTAITEDRIKSPWPLTIQESDAEKEVKAEMKAANNNTKLKNDTQIDDTPSFLKNNAQAAISDETAIDGEPKASDGEDLSFLKDDNSSSKIDTIEAQGEKALIDENNGSIGEKPKKNYNTEETKIFRNYKDSLPKNLRNDFDKISQGLSKTNQNSIAKMLRGSFTKEQEEQFISGLAQSDLSLKDYVKQQNAKMGMKENISLQERKDVALSNPEEHKKIQAFQKERNEKFKKNMGRYGDEIVQEAFDDFKAENNIKSASPRDFQMADVRVAITTDKDNAIRNFVPNSTKEGKQALAEYQKRVKAAEKRVSSSLGHGKAALAVGTAVTAGALVLGLSNSRGQQSNAQLYGQQPLSY